MANGTLEAPQRETATVDGARARKCLPSEPIDQVVTQLTHRMVRHGRRRNLRQRLRNQLLQLLLLIAVPLSSYLLWRVEIDAWLQSPTAQSIRSQCTWENLQAWFAQNVAPFLEAMGS